MVKTVKNHKSYNLKSLKFTKNKINCSLTFYTNIKYLIIEIRQELNKLCYFCEFQRFEVVTFVMRLLAVSGLQVLQVCRVCRVCKVCKVYTLLQRLPGLPGLQVYRFYRSARSGPLLQRLQITARSTGSTTNLSRDTQS